MEDYAIGGISIMVVILGLTQWLKDVFGLSGDPVKIISMVLGVVFGVAYQITLSSSVPLSQYFFVALFGLMMGLTASGIYSVVAKAKTPTLINVSGDVTLPEDSPIQ